MGEVSRLIAKLRDVADGTPGVTSTTRRGHMSCCSTSLSAAPWSKKELHRRSHAGHSARPEFRRPQDPGRRPQNRKQRHVRHAPRSAPAVHDHVQGDPGVFFPRLRLLPSPCSKSRGMRPRMRRTWSYVLNLDLSYFDLAELDGMRPVFRRSHERHGGKLRNGREIPSGAGREAALHQILPTVISALKGALRIVRALENVELYTLWMDPVLNEKAYILPGLGDAGDRINGEDFRESRGI